MQRCQCCRRLAEIAMAPCPDLGHRPDGPGQHLPPQPDLRRRQAREPRAAGLQGKPMPKVTTVSSIELRNSLLVGKKCVGDVDREDAVDCEVVEFQRLAECRRKDSLRRHARESARAAFFLTIAGITVASISGHWFIASFPTIGHWNRDRLAEPFELRADRQFPIQCPGSKPATGAIVTAMAPDYKIQPKSICMVATSGIWAMTKLGLSVINFPATRDSAPIIRLGRTRRSPVWLGLRVVSRAVAFQSAAGPSSSTQC